MLNLNEQTAIELKKVDTIEFNIFRIRVETQGNELMVTGGYILSIEGVF